MKLKCLLPAVLVLLMFAMPVGAAEEGEGSGGYIPLDPPFVMNLESSRRSHFMQIRAQVAVDSPQAAEAVKYHMPVIRNALIMFLSGRTVDEARSVQTREQWRTGALEEIQGAMQTLTGETQVSGLYFTGFVIQ